MSSFFSFLLNLLQKFFSAGGKKGPALIAPVEEDIAAQHREVLFRVTSAFEGGAFGSINYANITGNFDNQGLSIGFLQWCTGQGSDHFLFSKMYQDHPEVMKEAMGALYDQFVATLDWGRKDRLQWAVDINISGNRIKKVWRDAFLNLCHTVEFQAIQKIAAEKKVEKAIRYCDLYGLKTLRALSLMFDIRVQNGSISKIVHEKILARKSEKEAQLGRPLAEKEMLEIIAVERSSASNPRWVHDVMTRKMCIVQGKGQVHGREMNLSELGLSDNLFVR